MSRFQDLPSRRHVVAKHALTTRRFHAATLIVPMTLVNRQYFDEVIGALREARERSPPRQLLAGPGEVPNIGAVVVATVPLADHGNWLAAAGQERVRAV
jgi:hypothetical protein